MTLVEVSIMFGGQYWNGSAFVTSIDPIFLPATGTTNWSYPFTTSGTYDVNARLTDAATNQTTISGVVIIP